VDSESAEEWRRGVRTGTKSILFGVHQFIWHPVTVYAAWVWLYKRLPNWKETVCIIVHDWGYWGKEKMDDEEGEKHPEFGADVAGKFFGEDYYNLCLLHSRHYARNKKLEPSLLCWADKTSILFEPWWLYLPRAWASGELFEYREVAAGSGFIPLSASHRMWYRWIQNRLSTLGRERRGDVVPYVNPRRDP
jgi:hypothetical protein